MYSYLKFPSQVYHMPMPNYTAAYYRPYVADSMEWIDSVYPYLTYPDIDCPNSADLHQSQKHLLAKSGVDMSTPVHHVATPLTMVTAEKTDLRKA